MNEKFLNSFAKTELPKLGNVYLSAEKGKSQTSLWWEQKDSTFTHRTPMALFPLRWQYHKIWCKSNINSCLLDCSKDVKYLLKYYSECSWESTPEGSHWNQWTKKSLLFSKEMYWVEQNRWPPIHPSCQSEGILHGWLLWVRWQVSTCPLMQPRYWLSLALRLDCLQVDLSHQVSICSICWLQILGLHSL